MATANVSGEMLGNFTPYLRLRTKVRGQRMNSSIPVLDIGNGSLLVLSNFVYLAIFKTPENLGFQKSPETIGVS